MAKGSKTQQRLTELEKELKRRGVRLGYERLEYAGLRLKSGLCWFRGTYYLFVDRLKTLPERIDLIQGALDELDQLAAQGRLDRPDAPEAAPAPAESASPAAPAAEPGEAGAGPVAEQAADENQAGTTPELPPAPDGEAVAPAAPEASHEPR